MLRQALLLILGASQLGFAAQDAQHVFAPPPGSLDTRPEHVVDVAILNALKAHSDPVAALLSLHPEAAKELNQPRLLHVVGEEKPKWMTEGDKLRLRRSRKKFVDITDHEDFYAQQADASFAGKASRLNTGLTVPCRWLTIAQSCLS